MAEKLSARDKADIQKIAREVLGLQMSSKDAPIEIDDAKAISELNKANVDVKTRIFLGVVQNALKGDLKSAEFVFKQAGWEPVKENHITMEVPQIIDDMGVKVEPVKQAVEEVILYDDPDESN